MRIAILHNALDTIGGAEKVTLTLARELKADIYTTNIDKRKIRRMGFSARRIFSIGAVPKEQPYKHTFAFFRFSRLKLKGYDRIIVCGDWAISAAKRNRCIWYCHAPARELFDLYVHTLTHLVSHWQKVPFALWASYHRKRIIRYARRCDLVLCNSHNTQTRIKKYLDINADIVHPGIDTDSYTSKPAKDYWISVNRLLPHKQIKEQLDIFRRHPGQQLIIVACKEQAQHFERYFGELDIPRNVTMLSDLPEKKLCELYSEAKGMICTTLEEDFGLAPIEAMASGKPVIAPDEGGFRESVIDGKTGFLYQDSHNIYTCMYKAQRIKAADCIARAKEFDNAVFLEKIKKYL